MASDNRRKYTLYFDTGFAGINKPYSVDVLERAATRKEVLSSTYYKRDTLEAGYIDIKESYEAVQDVDYVKMSTPPTDGNPEYTNAFFQCIPQPIAYGVTRLNLKRDDLLTAGGPANLNFTSGWITRGHIAKTDDVLGKNTAAEPWSPSHQLEAVNLQEVEPTAVAENDSLVAISGADIHAMGQYTEGEFEVAVGKASGENVMYVPRVPAAELVSGTGEGTRFQSYDFAEAGYKQYSVPGSVGYDLANATIKRGISNLYAAGQLQLLNSYRLPKEWGSTADVTDGVYALISGIHQTVELSSMPYEYQVSGYTVKNKKTYSLYRQFSLVSIGSSDMSVKPLQDLYKAGDQYPSVNLWSDPSPTGKPYARFSNINSSPLQYSDCVKGLQWANNQIVLEGASGSLWNSISNAFANQTQERAEAKANYKFAHETVRQEGSMAMESAGYLFNPLGALASGGKTVAAGAIAGTTEIGVGGGVNFNPTVTMNAALGGMYGEQLEAMQQASIERQFAQQEINQARNEAGVELAKSNSVVSPYVGFSPEQNLGLYGYNKFVAYETRLADYDLISLDRFLQRYGYTGNERPLTREAFTVREHYVYIQATDINISTSLPKRVREGVIAELNGGVRIWREKPNAAAYDTN